LFFFPHVGNFDHGLLARRGSSTRDARPTYNNKNNNNNNNNNNNKNNNKNNNAFRSFPFFLFGLDARPFFPLSKLFSRKFFSGETDQTRNTSSLVTTWTAHLLRMMFSAPLLCRPPLNRREQAFVWRSLFSFCKRAL